MSGALLGLLFAQWGSRLLVQQLSSQTETINLDLTPDWRVLVFTATVAIATALIFGTVPALRGTRVEPNEAIKAQGRSIVGESRFGFGSALVVAQVALSLVLVVGGGLFMQSFARLGGVRLGYDPDPILIATVALESQQRQTRRTTGTLRASAASSAERPGCPARSRLGNHADHQQQLGHIDREPSRTIACRSRNGTSSSIQ